MNDNRARDDLNRFTDKAYAEMSAWEDRDVDLETSNHTTIAYIAIVALALMVGCVACWLRSHP
ncbi:hypothetical protein LJR231_001529 [Phyllobacterium sp. LjRoot231]|uniref:hypothetical protein n=1 Tax=Phyllobacterium sp. LjRoot231 TaxID=3342289 RepID=UPI003ECD4C7A